MDVEPARRIYGLETEFGVHLDSPQARTLTPEEIAGHLFHSVVEWGRSSNVFLPNASRLYIDVGAHPEYSTAECDSVEDLIASDRAGELIVHRLVAGATQRLRAAGVDGTLYLYKNNTDSHGNSYGCHENYLIRRRADFSSFAAALLPFFVSRQIMTGAGCVTRTPQGAHYSFSPRADHMWEGMSSATTRSRPMINTRDEPHANADLYRRLHVIVGDSTMAQPTTVLKIGATDLVLRLLEARVPLPDLELANEMRAIREIAHDVSGRTTVELADGRNVTATDMQSQILETVTAHVGTVIEPNEQVAQVLDMWERAITAVRTGAHDLVDTELDWAIKERLLMRYLERSGGDWTDPMLARIELAFHDIDPERSLARTMERDGLIATVVDPDAITRAIDNPPETTRAALRGRFIEAVRDSGRDYTVDWVHLKVSGHPSSTVLLKDPFRAQDERVDALVESLVAPQQS